MQENKIKSYAIALFEIGQELDCLFEFKKDVNVLKKYFTEEYLMVLQSNYLDKNERQDYLTKALKGRVHTKILIFLHILIENNLIAKLFHILDQFNMLYNEHSGLKYAKVYSVEELTEATLKKVEHFLKAKYKNKFIIENHIDKNLIGGIKIKLEDQVLDYSIISTLKALKNEI